jgi:hypothetical protein
MHEGGMELILCKYQGTEVVSDIQMHLFIFAKIT